MGSGRLTERVPDLLSLVKQAICLRVLRQLDEDFRFGAETGTAPGQGRERSQCADHLYKIHF